MLVMMIDLTAQHSMVVKVKRPLLIMESLIQGVMQGAPTNAFCTYKTLSFTSAPANLYL